MKSWKVSWIRFFATSSKWYTLLHTIYNGYLGKLFKVGSMILDLKGNQKKKKNNFVVMFLFHFKHFAI